MADSKMKSILKKAFIVLLVAFAAIQFIHPARNSSNAVLAEDMNTIYPIPDSVHTILDKACFDCHSNNTRYPWYASVQPVAWWLNDHIEEGKDELNFSEFGKRKLQGQAKKLKKLAKEVEEGEMPLKSYTFIHKEAVLTENEKKMLIDWARNLSEQIAQKAPAENK